MIDDVAVHFTILLWYSTPSEGRGRGGTLRKTSASGGKMGVSVKDLNYFNLLSKQRDTCMKWDQFELLPN